LEDALRLLDAAAENAREAGDEPLAARLAAQAADVAADLAELTHSSFDTAVSRARVALQALRDTGDRRRYVQSVDALFGMINMDHPDEALSLARDAAETARALGDEVTYGRAVYRVCDAALDLCDIDTFEEWSAEFDSVPLRAMERAEADVLTTTFTVLRSGDVGDATPTFLALADRMRQLGESRPMEAVGAAIASALWQGRVDRATELLANPETAVVPPVHQEIFRLTIRALAGPPWPVDDLQEPHDSSTHNERALLHYLRGEPHLGDELLRDRYQERLAQGAHATQRFTPYFPGALVAALGPADTGPDTEWLRRWIYDAPLPGLWPANRAVAALLLAERSDGDLSLLDHSLRLIGQLQADTGVSAWIVARCQALR
jgi:hypothetical protein